MFFAVCGGGAVVELYGDNYFSRQYVSPNYEASPTATVDDPPRKGRPDTEPPVEIGGGVDRAVSRAAVADVPRALRSSGGAAAQESLGHTQYL